MYKDEIESYLDTHPGCTSREAAESVGCNLKTVQIYRAILGKPGVCGRRKKASDAQIAEAVARWRSGEMTREEAAASIGVSVVTLYRREDHARPRVEPKFLGAG